MAACPGVREVAVVGMPDDKWGGAVSAFVAAEPGSAVHAAALDAHVHGRVAAFKQPRTWQFVDAPRRNAAGKILKHRLRSELPPPDRL